MVNDLRLSLRRYILWSLFSLAAILIILFSIQNSDSFFDGMDGMLKRTMIRVAERAELDTSGSAKILDFYISDQYNKLPEKIRSSFKPTDFQPYVLLKNINKPNWFKRPESAQFALLARLPNGDIRYVSQAFEAPPTRQTRPFHINRIIYNILLGLIALASFALALQFLMRSVTRPVEKLQQWAAKLDEKQLDSPIPSFKYKELDALAHIIHNSLQDVRTTLYREREFVNHASHELRTPIAVIRSSSELLQRVVDPDNIKGNNAIARIDHASKTMADLTETLLWLGRDTHETLPLNTINIKTMIEQISENLMYLLSGKEVIVNCHLENCELILPKTATEIMIGNVIRNAYQHTYCGSVEITLSNQRLTVFNTEKSSSPAPKYIEKENLDDGYGIGIKLIDKLATKLGWSYHHQVLNNGYQVVLSFCTRQQASDL